jgi:hypothetical protein
MDEHIKQIKKESIVSGDLDLAIKIRALEKYREDAFLSLVEKICKKEDYTYTEHFKGDRLFYSLRHKPNKSTSLMYEGIVEINNETPISEDYIKLRTLAIDTLCSETLKRQKENYHLTADEDFFVGDITDIKLDEGFVCFHTEDKVYRTTASEIKKLFNEPRIEKKIYSYISSLKKTFDYIFFKQTQ